MRYSYLIRLLSMTLSFVLFLSGCGSSDQPIVISTLPPATATVVATPMPVPTKANKASQGAINKICLASSLSDIETSGYNRYVYEGMQAIATDYNLEAIHVTSDKVADYEANIQKCLETKAEIIVIVAVENAEFPLKVAKENPKTFFIGVDHFVDNGPKNYVGIQFYEDGGAFLVGYLAGLATKSGVVAGIYGPDYPPLVRFRHGFEQGVAQAAKDSGQEIKVLGIYLESFADPEGGAKQAKEYISQGADVIFGAAGLTGNGAILAAAQQKVYVIGVDQDEYLTTFQNGKVDGSQYIISSVIKRVDVGVFDMLSALVENRLTDFPGGSNYILSVANGGLSFASRHEADISEELYNKVTQVESKLANGELTTGVNPDTGELLNPPK